MKFVNNSLYYILLHFFLIIHAKFITSAKIKSLGVTQNFNNLKDNNHSKLTKISFNQENNQEILSEESNLDLYNNNTSNIQNSFLEIKNILTSDIVPQPNLPQNHNENKIQTKDNDQSFKNNYSTKPLRKDFKNKEEKSSKLNPMKNSNDDLMNKLKDLEDKFTRNIEAKKELKLENQMTGLILERINLKNKISNKLKKNAIENEIEDPFETIDSEDINIDKYLNLKFAKKRYLEEQNKFMFYNSLSLIMLSMLGGGVIGIIFILYFSYKDENNKL